MLESFEPFPTLETKRLKLRRLTVKDAPRMFEIHIDPAVGRYLSREPDREMQQMEERLRAVEEGVTTHSSIRFALERRDTGLLIGSGGFWRWNKSHHNAEIGYELASEQWGQGLMTEALGAILRFGFDHMDLHRVEANTDPDNAGSQAVLKKLGFQVEGRLRQNWHYEGRYTDSTLFGLLAGELCLGHTLE